MSSKFLSGGGATTDVIALLNAGNQTLDVASITDQSLVPNLPVCANGSKKIIGRQIGVSDINFSVLSNPMAGDLDMGNNYVRNSLGLFLNNNGDVATPSPGSIDIYSSGETLYYQDSSAINHQVATSNDLNNYVLKAGDTMSGTLNMGTNNLTNVNQLNGVTASNLVNTASTGVSGDVVTFVNGKEVQDSGVLLSSLATTSSLAAYMPIAGGTFTGPVSMGTQIFTVNNMSDNGSNGMVWGSGSTASNIDSIVVGRNSSAFNDSCIFGRNSTSAGQYGVTFGINNSSANNTPGNVAVGSFCNASGDTTPITGGGGAIALGYTVTASNREAIAIGSGITNNTASSLLLGGVFPMVNWRTNSDNTCDLGITTAKFKDLYLNGNLISSASSKPVDDIFLRTGSVTMTGALNMGSNNLTNVNNILTSSTTVTVGNSNSNSNPSSVCVGANNNIPVSGGGLSVVYGNTNNMSASTNGQNIIYGNSNTDSNASGGVFMYGFGNTNGTGARNILIGRNNTIPDSVNDAIVFGFNGTNSTSSSLLLKSISSNIRTGSNNTCDLGVLSTAQFNNVYANNFTSDGAVSIAATSATSLALGRTGITTTVNGSCVLPVAYGSWYSTATYTPVFSAGVARLIPPTSSSNGPQVDISFAGGVLTYTGARPSRVFSIRYNISFLQGANGANMTFFNSKNGNLVVSAVQTRIFQQVTTQTAGTRISLHFSDNVVLNNGDTIQLAASCATASAATSFDFVSCNITAIQN